MNDKIKFSRIVAIDHTGLVAETIEKLDEYSTHLPIVYNDNPKSDEAIISRIGDADCALLSWNTVIARTVIEACPNLKYIGLCCSLYDEASSNVDIAAARERGITVSGVRDYGDEGLVEFVISELIQLCKGLGKVQWKDEPVELTGRQLGIVGLGATGRMLADRAMSFNMNVSYFNRSRKPEAESSGIAFKSLADLLSTSDFVSLHLPRNTNILGADEFVQLGDGKVLINTSLGLVFDESAFVEWVKGPNNYAIFDADGIGDCAAQFSELSGVVISAKVSGWTREARRRLSRKVLDNMIAFLTQYER